MKTLIAAACTALAMLASAAHAQEQKTEGRLTAELTFASIDQDAKGFLHLGDLEAFRSDVFVSMDTDNNGKLTYNEFRAWDPGFSYIAERDGKMEAYDTAIRIVFGFWDRNKNGEITESEMRFAMNTDFRRADLNGDSILSEAEFLEGFAIIVAIRAAIGNQL